MRSWKGIRAVLPAPAVVPFIVGCGATPPLLARLTGHEPA